MNHPSADESHIEPETSANSSQFSSDEQEFTLRLEESTSSADNSGKIKLLSYFMLN